jgi:hypothetical protein
LSELNGQSLSSLDDVDLLHRIDELVSQFDELDPQEAGDALGALVQELAERHTPDAVVGEFQRQLLERDPDRDLEADLATVREGMARRERLRREEAALSREGVRGGRARPGQ